MYSIRKAFIAGIVLCAFSGCAVTAEFSQSSSLENPASNERVISTAQSVPFETTTAQSANTQTSAATEIMTTQANTIVQSLPQYRDGELTTRLGEELNALFDSGKFTFIEITKTKEPVLHVEISAAEGGREYSLSYDSVSGENEANITGLVNLHGTVYGLDSETKTVMEQQSNVRWGWVKEVYTGIFPPNIIYKSTTAVEKDGKSLTCETWVLEANEGAYDFYYDGTKLAYFNYSNSEEQVFSKTIEYSSEADESLFESVMGKIVAGTPIVD